MVSIDIYVNETTRHADVILPAPSPLERSHYDLALYGFAVRNVANYSPPVLDRPDGDARRVADAAAADRDRHRPGAGADIAAIDDFVAAEAARRQTAIPGSPVEGHDPAEVLAALAPRVGPERLLDLMLRSGPYEARRSPTSRRRRTGSTSARCEPRLPDVLRTPSGKIELAPRAARRRRRAAARGAGRAGATAALRPHRPARPALEQLVDAQPAAAGERPDALHRCTCTPTTPSGSGLVDGAPARVRSRGGRDRGAGRGHRRRDARRRLDPARLGPRRRRRAMLAVAARARRARTPTCSPTRLLLDAAVGHRGAQRDPGRARAGDRGGARRRGSVGRIRRAARHMACRRSAAGPYPTDRVPAFNANPQRHGSKLGPTFAQGCRNCSVSSNSGVSPALARGSARAFKQKRGRVATSARPLADSPIKKARCPINLAAGTLLRRPSASHPGPRPCRAEPWSRPPITLRRRRRP